MASTDQVDILLQFQLAVMQGMQRRFLNASPLTTLWVHSPFSRRIEQAIPSLEVKACWNKPEVTLHDGEVELSAELAGGARQAISGRITPGGSITEFSLPAGKAGPTAITTGPDGNLWFIEPDGNKIGRITPGGKFTGFSAPPNTAIPGGNV
jgi:hypothetical protein